MSKQEKMFSNPENSGAGQSKLVTDWSGPTDYGLDIQNGIKLTQLREPQK